MGDPSLPTDVFAVGTRSKEGPYIVTRSDVFTMQTPDIWARSAMSEVACCCYCVEYSTPDSTGCVCMCRLPRSTTRIS